MDDVVKCSYEECQNLHRELKDLIMKEFATGPNSKAQIPSMVNADIGMSHLTVKVFNMPSLNMTQIVTRLTEWREGTTIQDEVMPGNKTKVYFISVPILKKRPRHYEDDRQYTPVYNRAPGYPRTGEAEKPSSTTAMLYVMGLFLCGTVIVYKAAVGQAPYFLVSMLN